jgi:hypothetical protein
MERPLLAQRLWADSVIRNRHRVFAHPSATTTSCMSRPVGSFARSRQKLGRRYQGVRNYFSWLPGKLVVFHYQPSLSHVLRRSAMRSSLSCHRESYIVVRRRNLLLGHGFQSGIRFKKRQATAPANCLSSSVGFEYFTRGTVTGQTVVRERQFAGAMVATSRGEAAAKTQPDLTNSQAGSNPSQTPPASPELWILAHVATQIQHIYLVTEVMLAIHWLG